MLKRMFDDLLIQDCELLLRNKGRGSCLGTTMSSNSMARHFCNVNYKDILIRYEKGNETGSRLTGIVIKS
jgi:hypothetical protein